MIMSPVTGTAPGKIILLGEHAVVALFLLVNVMQDLFGKHFHLCIVEFVPGIAFEQLGDEKLGSVVLHICLIESFILYLAAN